MREMLYPWMPSNALCQPYLFYRFSETIRNTLIWKSFGILESNSEKKNYILKCSDNTVVTPIDKDELFLIYQWNSHHYVKANKTFLEIYNFWNKPNSLEEGILLIKDCLSVSYSNYEIRNMIYKLIANGFFSIEKNVSRNYRENILESTYDQIYFEKKFPYAVKIDNWLNHYKEQIPIGMALEIGIGTGKNIPMLLNRGYKIQGIDISSQAIYDLQKKYPMPECFFIQADIREYPIESNSYDLIVCSMVFHYIDYSQLFDVATKIQNALKPNGYLFVSVLSIKDPLKYVDLSQNLFVKTFFSCDMIKRLFNKLQIIELSDTYSYEPQREHPKNYFGLILYMGKKNL